MNSVYKQDFPLLQQRINDEPFVYLDSAASVPMPLQVQQEVQRFLNEDYANVHRGVYTTSMRASEQYENVRQVVKEFIHAQDDQEVVFTSGTTDSLNLVASSFGELFIQPGDEIFVSVLEHHANLVPWQELAKRKQANLVFMPVTEDGWIDVSAVADMVSEKTKIIAVTHVSNVLGTINDIDTLAQIIHDHNGVIVVDMAQSIPHQEVDVAPFDFVAFSGHKMGALNGVGVLCAKRQWLEQMAPIRFGGDMIQVVSDTHSTWNEVPYKFEAGTPNIVGVISLGAAIKWLQTIGMEVVRQHEQQLLAYVLDKLQHVQGVHLYGSHDVAKKSGALAFTVDGIHPHDVATGLDMEGIAVRAGNHCAQPLMRYLRVPATVRLSIYIYNTQEDMDRFVAALVAVKEYFSDGII